MTQVTRRPPAVRAPAGATDRVRAWARVAHRPAAVGALVLAIGVAWLFSSALFSSKVLGGDSNLLFQYGFDAPPGLTEVNPDTFDAIWVFHPDMLEARRQMRSLELPSWTSHIGAGEPLLATQQNASLYPLNLPMLALPFWQSLEWLAALKLLVAGVGMLLFLGALGLRRPAAAFGAVAYAFSTYLITWVEHPHVNSYVLIPWALLFAHRLARDGGTRSAALLGATFGCALLGGQPEAAFFLAVVTTGWFAVSAPGRRAIGLFAGAVAAGAALGAVMLLPFAELASNATQLGRGGGSGQPRNWLLTFFMPELWGRPDKWQVSGYATPFAERTAYFGALPLMLAAGGLAARRVGRPQIYFTAVGLLALGMSVHVPVYTHLVDNLPVLRAIDMRRALVLSVLSGSVLAAFGADALLRGDRREQLRLLAGAALVAVVPLVWLAGHRYLLHSFGHAWHQLPVMSASGSDVRGLQMGVVLRWALIALFGGALIALAIIRPRLAQAAALAIVALTLIDLVTIGRGFHPAIPQAQADPPTPPFMATFLKTSTGGPWRYAGGSSDFGPNVAERYELRDARQHAQPIIERRQLLWTAVGGGGIPQRTWLTEPNNRLTDMFAVKFLLGPALANMNPSGWEPTSAQFTLARTSPPPRAWLTYGWKPASGMTAALNDVKAATIDDDRARPVIEGVAAASGAPGTASVTWLRDDEKSVRLRAVAKRPAQLVLADTFYPGWQAKVDGKRVRIHPANVAFRAVAVPAGTHTIEFDYKPWSVRIGALLSLLAALGIAAALVLTRNRSARTPRSSRQP